MSQKNTTTRGSEKGKAEGSEQGNTEERRIERTVMHIDYRPSFYDTEGNYIEEPSLADVAAAVAPVAAAHVAALGELVQLGGFAMQQGSNIPARFGWDGMGRTLEEVGELISLLAWELYTSTEELIDADAAGTQKGDAG